MPCPPPPPGPTHEMRGRIARKARIDALRAELVETLQALRGVRDDLKALKDDAAGTQCRRNAALLSAASNAAATAAASATFAAPLPPLPPTT